MSSPNIETEELATSMPEEIDPAAHRRIQNRLNQRASRKRRAAQLKKHGQSDLKWVIYTDHANTSKTHSPPVKPDNNQPNRELIHPAMAHMKRHEPKLFNDVDLAKRYQQLNDIRKRALHSIAHQVTSPSATLCISQYNILRAMCANAKVLGLTMELLNEDIASQFNIIGQSTFHLPASLLPSESQKEIVHHPWVDIIPILSLREALLIREDVCEEDEFCGDLYGVCASTNEVGLRVWGEAWDPSAYEASESLLRKWCWIPEECPDILQSTNYWRKKRGERALVLPLS